MIVALYVKVNTNSRSPTFVCGNNAKYRVCVDVENRSFCLKSNL